MSNTTQARRRTQVLAITLLIPCLVFAGFFIASFIHPDYSHNPHNAFGLWFLGFIASGVTFGVLSVVAAVVILYWKKRGDE